MRVGHKIYNTLTSQKAMHSFYMLLLSLVLTMSQSCSHDNNKLDNVEAKNQINDFLKQKGTVLTLSRNNYLYSFDLLTKPYLLCIENLKSNGYIDCEIIKHDSSTEIKNLKLNNIIKPYLKTNNESANIFIISVGYYQAQIDSISEPITSDSTLSNCYVTFKKGNFIPNEIGKICNYSELFTQFQNTIKTAQFVNTDKYWTLLFCEN